MNNDAKNNVITSTNVLAFHVCGTELINESKPGIILFRISLLNKVLNSPGIRDRATLTLNIIGINETRE